MDSDRHRQHDPSLRDAGEGVQHGLGRYSVVIEIFILLKFGAEDLCEVK